MNEKSPGMSAMEPHLRATTLWFRIGGVLGVALPLTFAWLFKVEFEWPVAAAAIGAGFAVCGHFLARSRRWAKAVAGVLLGVALAWLSGWAIRIVLDMRDIAAQSAESGLTTSEAIWVNSSLLACTLAMGGLCLSYLWVLFSKRGAECFRKGPSPVVNPWHSPLMSLPFGALILHLFSIYIWFTTLHAAGGKLD